VRPLAWFVAAVLEQARRHPALGEPATKGGGPVGPTDDDAVIDSLEVDVGPWPQPGLLPQFLWDHDLALCPYPLSHTAPV
jgi:hypothetical protein